MSRDIIAVLDFGSQYAHLIAKRIRHLGIYTEIHSPVTDIQKLKKAKGVIFSGGPSSVFGDDTPAFNSEILSLDLPILGLCYGHQLIALQYEGSVENLGRGEFGKAVFETTAESPLWVGIGSSSQVWMSHGDTVTKPPKGFHVIGRTKNGPVAAMQHESRPMYTLQFHPEVKDSVWGRHILGNFVKVCGAHPGWSMETFVEEAIEAICQTVGERNVLMFLSGGVDSSVAFALLNKALGHKRVLGLFIDNGFMRKDEGRAIMERYHELGYENIKALDASKTFLEAVAGKVDPQEKRHQVGATFIKVRDQFLQQLNLDPDLWMLGQGTLYPDIIESGGTEHSHVIKSHHNRVKEVQDLMLEGKVVEPLKELYKDEVRKLGEILGLPETLVWRHPFPGPGLSINVLCDSGTSTPQDTEGTLSVLKQSVAHSDYTVDLLPVRSVGVQGDQRTYAQPAVLVGTHDWDLLEQTAIQITNAVRDVNRVVTLLSPATLPSLQTRQAYCTKDRLDLLREADALATQALVDHGLMREIFQLLVILLPLSTEGRGDCVVLRPVCSEDVMTAQFAKIDWDIVLPLADTIRKLPGIDAVFYDVTHKPPGTFGWE